MAHIAPKQVYWIGCSGTGYVVMDEARLEDLLENMTTLRFLLFGHPNMAEPRIKKCADGTKVLEIPPALEIHQSSFLLLVNCFVGAEPLPQRVDGSRLQELMETITKLGGCERLEQQLQGIAVSNPMTPAEDVENKYIWAIIQYDMIFHTTMADMMARGYSYTTTKKVDFVQHHYFRAERRQQTDSEN